jgi:hypothetical protein
MYCERFLDDVWLHGSKIDQLELIRQSGLHVHPLFEPIWIHIYIYIYIYIYIKCNA